MLSSAAAELDGRLTMQAFYAKNTQGIFFKDELTSFLKETATDLDIQPINDFYDAHRVVNQFQELWLLAAGVMAIALLIRYLSKKAAVIAREAAEDLKLMMFSVYLAEKAIDLLILAIKAVVIVVVCVLIFRLVSFNVCMPNGMLPPEYILDFDFYKSHISAQTACLNDPGTILSSRFLFFRFACLLSFVCLVAELILSLAIFVGLNKTLINDRIGHSDQVKAQKITFI